MSKLSILYYIYILDVIIAMAERYTKQEEYSSTRSARTIPPGPEQSCRALSLPHEQASHSFIRSAMRKTIAAVEASGAGSSNGEGDGGSATDGITETLGGFLGTFEEGCGVGGVVSSDAAQHDPRVIIEMDRVRSRTGNHLVEK